MVIKRRPIKNMKQIPNKVTEIDGTFDKKDGLEGEIERRKTKYSDLIMIVMSAVHPDNNTLGMRKDFRVIDAVEKAVKESGTIDLEDEDAKHLLSKIKGHVWGFKNKGIIEFEEDIDLIVNPKKQDKKEDKAEAKKTES